MRQSAISIESIAARDCTGYCSRSRSRTAPTTASLPNDVHLAAKDRPILLAAIHAKCSDLLTGDRRHFGSLFGRSVKGVRIVTVREYLTRRTAAEDPPLGESDN